MLCACREKDGLKLRMVEHIEPNAVTMAWLILMLRKRKSFLEHVGMADAISMLLDKSTHVLGIDDVGAVILTNIAEGYAAEVHVTFWDGRVRGRERMCRKMAKLLMDKFRLEQIFCLIPEGNTVGLRLAQAVGFKEGRHENGNVLLYLERRGFTVKQLPGVM